MLKKHALFSLALLSSATLYAIPIESRGLSNQNTDVGISGSSTPITGNMNWDLIQKNQQLENQIRELRGKIEEQDNAIEQLNKELSNRYTDLDQRLELMAQKLEADADATDESHPDTTTPDGQESTQPAPTNTPKDSTTQTPIATTANSQNTVQSKPEDTTNSSNAVELEKAAYTIALDAYKQGGAQKAIAPMQNFIKNNPNGVYTGNAYFWLAEFNLAIEPPNYEEAKKNYEVVAAKYSNSSKAPRALYRLYSIATEVNKNPQTANVYKNKLLSTFPDSEEAHYLKNS